MSLEDAVDKMTSTEKQAPPLSAELLKGTLAEVPSASKAFAEELWQHPGQAGLHALKTVSESAVMGAAVGYLVPARGPAALIVAAGFTVPMVVKAYDRLSEASNQAAHGADVNEVEKSLAKDSVSGAYDLSLGLAGGVGGTEIGVRAATSRTALGTIGQFSQRAVMNTENFFMGHAAEALKPAPAKVENNGLESAETISISPKVQKTGLAARLEQHGIVNPKLDKFLEPGGESKLYFGSLHGHSLYSDGMGYPKDLYNRAIAEGQDVTTITDHNHLAARTGVAPGDPRAADQAKEPIIASNPIEYSQTFKDAADTTTDGKHVSLVGTELGTIGHVGGGHGHPHDEVAGKNKAVGPDMPEDLDEHHTHGMANPEGIGLHNPGNKPFDLAQARAESNAAAHIGGVNHANLFEVPTFFESVRQERTGPTAAIMRAMGMKVEPVVTAPDVVKINDGDYLNLVNHLDTMKATDGGTPIIQLNHPRYLADENPNTPAELRGRDYGQKSFKSQQEWLDRFATPYVRQIELIKGGALNPNPVDTVGTGELDPTSFAGYLDKGVHASPTFGRDFHFGDPVGNPGATGIYADSLTKPGILDALRERRTIATTSSKNLSGVLTGNDQFMMGSILDHSVVPSLALKMKVEGSVDPDASYTLKLWGDTKIGDGDLAKVVQEKKVKGSDLLASNQTFAFDPVKGISGQNSAYYVEVQRQAAGSTYTDRMWTAPIWLENLAGSKHTLYSKFMAGQVGQQVPGLYNSAVSYSSMLK
jgi:hypothetical protein